MYQGNACGINGTAAVSRTDVGDVTWDHADEEVHISTDLLADPSSRTFIAAKYEIGEGCAAIPGTRHGRLLHAS